MEGLIIIGFIGVLFGFGVQRYADRRGFNPVKAFWLGFFFGLFALIGYWIAATTQHRYV